MSRYVEVAIAVGSRRELAIALDRLGIAAELGDEPIMLRSGVECSGAPVDIRVGAGVHGCVEEFGFLIRGTELVLVCGEVDRRRLEPSVVAPLVAELARQRLAQAGLDVNVVREGGTTRVAIRRP